MPKKKRKKKKTSKVWKNYKVEKGQLVKDKTCPKCGSHVFLAKHKDRLTCGSCGYCEFLK